MASQTVWRARKRWGFLGLPWTFTVYTLKEDKILVDTGFFNKKQEETRLYRILDWTVTRSFWQRIFGMGTITCRTSDASDPVLTIKNIKKPIQVKEALSELVERERVSKRVSAREFMTDHDHCEGHDFDHDFDDSHIDPLN